MLQCDAMPEREPTGRGVDVERLHAEAKATFDFDELIALGSPHVDVPADLAELSPDGVRITQMAAGIFSDGDAYNHFKEWARPLREAAAQRINDQTLESLRGYAVGVHLRGAREHTEVLSDPEQVIEMMAEEQYDRDYGWPFLVLYACLKK